MWHRPNKLFVMLIFAASISSAKAHAEDSEETSTLEVPRQLIGHGFKLRFLGHDEALKEDTISLDVDRKFRAELLDRDHRILSRGTIIPDTSVTLYPRNWSLGLATGSLTPTPNALWKKPVSLKTVQENSLDLTCRLGGPWKFWGQVGRRDGQRKLDNNLGVGYRAKLIMVGGVYEIAPWGSSPTSPVRDIHVGLIGALGLNQSHYRLSDGYTGLTSDVVSPAAAFGAEISLPIMRNIWVTVRNLGRIEFLKIDELGVHHGVLLNSMSAGVRYAF